MRAHETSSRTAGAIYSLERQLGRTVCLPNSVLQAIVILVLSAAGRIEAGQSAARRETPLDFSRDVQPIFAEYCLRCHGAEEPASGLRLNDRTAVLGKADSGEVIVVPGRPDSSELVRRVTTPDAGERMPPEGEKPLPSEAVERLRQWVAQGAPWSGHWAFQPLVAPAPPSVRDAAWMKNGVDRFVLARLEERGRKPSPEADRYTLIRRLYTDLLGLPPSIDDVDRFVQDTSPQAWESLVERLLQSPHFGERWGRHWLDLAHYADSDGYEKDRARPDAYLFRDWVIGAINSDMPFDQFTIEQLAGDLLPGATSRQRLATAFLRQTLTNEEGGVDQEEYRIAAAFDRTETVGTVWLGLTVGCARCHTHKYDPLPHEEYYRLFAFFNNADEVTRPLPMVADRLAELESKLWPLAAELDARYAELAPRELAWEREQHRRISSQPAGPLSKDAQRAESGEQRAGKSKDREEPSSEDAAGISDKAIVDALKMYPEKRIAATRERLFDYYVTKVACDERVKTLRTEIAELQNRYQAQLTDVRTIAAPRLPRETHLFHRGEFLSPKQRVSPGVPAVLAAFRSRSDSPDRLDLARWLVAPENGLTPRVAVNHVWQHLFGEGLVRTPSDFGVRGQPPTHPELLDWLACRFQRDLKWSRKELIRLIVTSATYRQASFHRPELESEDPLNALLFRQSRFRVESEIVRDLHLAVSGLLSNRIGGKSVFPPMPADLAKLSYADNFSWKNSEGEDRYRRGLYTFFKRTIPHPHLMTFDSPDANVACTCRTVSNTPLQALTLLNSESHVEAGQAFARRVLQSPHQDDAGRLTWAWRSCLARPPLDSELAALERVLAVSRTYYAAHLDEAAQLAGRHAPEHVAATETAAWITALRVVLNLDEFVTRE